jgi:alkyl hydroperoxide reductase subunit AhpC
MSLINTTVKPFMATAFHNGEFVQLTDADLKGQWSVLIFMPAAFTFNCPTEIEDAADNYAAFKDAGAWTDERAVFSVHPEPFTVLAPLTKSKGKTA